MTLCPLILVPSSATTFVPLPQPSVSSVLHWSTIADVSRSGVKDPSHAFSSWPQTPLNPFYAFTDLRFSDPQSSWFNFCPAWSSGLVLDRATQTASSLSFSPSRACGAGFGQTIHVRITLHPNRNVVQFGPWPSRHPFPLPSAPALNSSLSTTALSSTSS